MDISVAIIGPLQPGPADQLIESYRSLSSDVFICTSNVDDHLTLGLPLVAPCQEGLLGSLVAALSVMRHERILVVEAARLPALPVMRRLACATGADDVVLIQREERSFTPGCYGRTCLRPLERALRRDLEGPEEVLRGLRVREEPSCLDAGH